MAVLFEEKVTIRQNKIDINPLKLPLNIWGRIKSANAARPLYFGDSCSNDLEFGWDIITPQWTEGKLAELTHDEGGESQAEGVTPPDATLLTLEYEKHCE